MAAARSSSPFTLLHLPLEIRRLIYQSVLQSPHRLRPTPEALRPADIRSHPAFDALLWTCHQIRDEASSIFIKNNTFHLSPEARSKFKASTLNQHVRHLDISFIDQKYVHWMCIYSREVRMAAFLHASIARCPDLESLTVRFPWFCSLYYVPGRPYGLAVALSNALEERKLVGGLELILSMNLQTPIGFQVGEAEMVESFLKEISPKGGWEGGREIFLEGKLDCLVKLLGGTLKEWTKEEDRRIRNCPTRFRGTIDDWEMGDWELDQLVKDPSRIDISSDDTDASGSDDRCKSNDSASICRRLTVQNCRCESRLLFIQNQQNSQLTISTMQPDRLLLRPAIRIRCLSLRYTALAISPLVHLRKSLSLV